VGSGGTAQHILNLSTNGVFGFSPWPLYPRERASGSNWIGDWMGPRAGLDTVVKRKKSQPLLGIEPRSSSL